jgi:hypothetical protein
MVQTLPQADPNVKLPPAVLALAAAAAARQEAYIQEMGGEQPQDPPAEQPLHDGGTVQPTPPAPPVDEPELPFEEESYKQKFLSAQGRLEKATSRIGEMSEQIASMQRSMQDLQARVQGSAEPQSKTYAKLITPEEEEEFGQEFLDVVGRKAQELIEPLKADYEMKFGRLEQQVKGVNGFVHQNVRDSLETTMDRDVPNWRDINYQPEFLDWLKLPDPYSGGIRMNMLKAAYDQNDTARVRAFFKGFLAEEAATTPAGYQPDRNPQPAAGGTGKIPLESLAAPGRAKSAAANGAPTEKPVFTRAQITQFYLDKTNGRFRGRESEAARIEQQIFEAQNEGRIR